MSTAHDEKLATLTDRQREIYQFARDLIVSRGYGPTVRDIGRHFGIRSPNGVMCHLHALEKKGLIVREKGKSRAVSLVDNPITNLIAVAREAASQLAFTEMGARLTQAIRATETVGVA